MAKTKKMTDAQRSDLGRRLLEGETVTLIGSCPVAGCRHGLRMDVDHPLHFLPEDCAYGNRHEHPQYPEAADRPWVGTMAWLNDRDGHLYGDRPTCPDHPDRLYSFGVLTGRVSNSPCSSACTEATSEKCSCQCGGANHGVEAA